MTSAGLWIRAVSAPRIHQPRIRRACLGELVQIDSSNHAWFEDRAPACTLLSTQLSKGAPASRAGSPVLPSQHGSLYL